MCTHTHGSEIQSTGEQYTPHALPRLITERGERGGGAEKRMQVPGKAKAI